MSLSSAHETELFEGSAIDRDVAAERGYETVGKNEVPEMFGTSQRGPGLLLPIHSVHGEVASYQLKRNEPRTLRCKLLKYETPRGTSVMIDVPPRCLGHIGDPYKPLWITEGQKKADSAISAGLPCVIDIPGVWNWRGSNSDDGLTVLGDWEMIALKGKEGPRNVVLAFDSDITSNVGVQKGATRLKRFLVSKGANVSILVLPDLPDGSKCGLDDWFATGGTLEDLREFVQADVPAPVVDRGEAAPFSDDVYRGNEKGFFRVGTKDGEEAWNRMTDFTAWIVAQTSHPERPELNYAEVMLRNRQGQLQGPYRVLDSEFRQVDGRNGWLGMFGSSVRVFAGVTNAHLVNAVQVASGDVPVVTVYDRLGWMKDADGRWWYLTSAGALGADGLDASIRVEPGGRLNDYQLQDASDTEVVKAAVRALLDVQTIAQTDHGVAAVITVMAVMMRSILIPARRMSFTTSIVGETGSGKSALAGIMLQMFGPSFGYDHLTDNWSSTLNSLLDMASRARHAPMVVDDYVEVDTGVAGLGRQAHSRDTLVRMIANSASKGRLKADATRNDGAEPETGLISTQETTGSFRHASEAARQLFVNVEKRGDGGHADISIDAIKQRTREFGRTGIYNLALSGYIQSLAAGMDVLTERIGAMHDRALETLSKRTSGLGLHERTLPALADLAIAWDTFISYALKVGAIDSAQAEQHRETGTLALLQVAQDQATEQDAERPENVIIEILQELFSSRQACLRDRHTDDVPADAIRMGWTAQKRETLTGTDTQFRAARAEIGWIDDDYVYLMPKPTAQAMQAIARDSRIVLPAGEKMLGTTLVRSGVALPGEGGKSTRPVEIGALTDAGGNRKRAIRIPRATIFPELVHAHDFEPVSNITEMRRVPA